MQGYIMVFFIKYVNVTNSLLIYILKFVSQVDLMHMHIYVCMILKIHFTLDIISLKK